MEEVSKKNPRKDPELVSAKKQEIKSFLEKWKLEIDTRQMLVFIVAVFLGEASPRNNSMMNVIYCGEMSADTSGEEQR